MTCSPGNNPHADRPNFTHADYMAMVAAGEAEYSLSEAPGCWACRGCIYIAA